MVANARLRQLIRNLRPLGRSKRSQPVRFPSPAEQMVREQIRRRGIRDPRVIEAMMQIDRRRFVPGEFERRAFEDNPLPIGFEQTISQPYIVAAMTELLRIESSHRVLEIGTGSGYQTAILARLCREVVTIERVPELSDMARITLSELGLFNVEFHVADGSFGWREKAPYDRILVTAAARKLRPELLEQLAPGGILIAPEGEPYLAPLSEDCQKLRRWVRCADDFLVEDLMNVRFVPLVEDTESP